MSEPFWSALGGGAVDYEGAWSAAKAYAPGDVVRYNGVDYLAVNPSTGVEPLPAVVAGAVPTLPVTVQGDGHSFDGIFNWLGTDGLRASFKNPADAGTVPLYSASTGAVALTGRKTGPGLVGRYTAAQDSNQDGNRTADKATDHMNDDIVYCTHTSGAAPCWWRADFGANRRFVITRWSMWSRPTVNGHANWKIQGSNDASAWTDLYTGTGYPTDYVTPVTVAISAAAPWRYIRWINAAGGIMSHGEIEMWGTLSEV